MEKLRVCSFSLPFLDSSVSPNYTLLEKAREDIALSGDNVLDAKTEILGSQEYEDVYVKFGDMINLTCVVSDVPAPPKHVFWYHDEKVNLNFRAKFFFKILFCLAGDKLLF